MKKKLFLPFLILFTFCAFGQTDKDKEQRNQIKQMKSSHIATALNLTGAESAKFWPLYLAYEEKVYEIRHNKIRPLNNKIEDKGIDALKGGDALLYVIQLQAAEEDLFNLRKKLILDLKPIIGPKKILKLFKAEEDFNKLLLNRYKNKRE